MPRVVPAALAIAVLAACRPAATELTDQQRTAITEEVAVAVAGFWDAWATADVDRGMAFMADDATAVTSGAQILRGRQTKDDAWRPMFETVASQVIDFEDTHITVFGPDFVCVQQRGTFDVTETDGGTGYLKVFAYTTVWTRRDGVWKVVAGHRSDPPASPAG